MEVHDPRGKWGQFGSQRHGWQDFCKGLLDIVVNNKYIEIVSEYDQEIPQLQTADKPMSPRGRATQQSLDTRKTNYTMQPVLSSPPRGLQN